MAVPANLLAEAPLASPELALVDPELAAELRRTYSPFEDRWLRPPARVENASAESEEPSAQPESADDDGQAGSRDAEPLQHEFTVATPPEQAPTEELRPSSLYPVLPAPEREEVGFEDSQTPPPESFGEVSAKSDDATALWAVAEVLREAEAVAERVFVDEYLTATPEHMPAEGRTTSHYPVLPASEADANATDATDAALRRIREGLTEADESQSRKRRIRRGFTLGSGVVAAFAVAALGADVQPQVAQLPSWLQF